MQKLSTRTLTHSLLHLTIALTIATTPALAQQAAEPAVPSAQASATKSPADQPVDTNKPLRMGPHTGIKPPKVIHSVDPVYPADARLRDVSATVHLHIWVDTNGDPSHIEFGPADADGFQQAALNAIQQYKFKPATLNGTPVTVEFDVIMKFQKR